MKAKLFLILAMVGVLAMASLTGCGASGTVAADTPQTVSVNLNTQQGIWVSGEGKVTVVPDIATLNLGVSAQAGTVAQAQSQAATAMEKMMTVLGEWKVSEKDIKTQYYNIHPLYRYDRETGESTITGYMVSNTANVKIRDIEQAGAIIDAVAAAGGDNTIVQGISFSVDRPEEYYSQARQMAVKDAWNKAEELASLAGVTLGKAIYISEGSATPYMPYMPIYRDSKESFPSTPISPGEMDITLSVQIAYAIH